MSEFQMRQSSGYFGQDRHNQKVKSFAQITHSVQDGSDITLNDFQSLPT